MNVMFILHPKKAFSDVVEGVTSKNLSLGSLECLIFSFCVISALNLLVKQCTILQVF